jgi:hypothetical protein
MTRPIQGESQQPYPEQQKETLHPKGKEEAVESIASAILMKTEASHITYYRPEKAVGPAVKAPPVPILEQAKKSIKEESAPSKPLIPHIPETGSLANQITASAKSQTSVQDPGRNVLLREMLKSPEALVADITRVGDIKIGPYSYEFEDLTSEEIYTSLANNLADYIKHENPNLTISQECINELLFALVQNFMKPVQTISEHDSRIELGTWGSDALAVKDLFSYEMKKGFLEKTPFFSSTEIEFTRRMEKTYVWMKNPDAKPAQHVILETKVLYNLKTLKVSFHYSYSLNGEPPTEWNTQDPFREKAAASRKR